MDTLIGKKIGMTQIFAESGTLTPVSVIQAGPCPVVQVKTVEKDGYNAVQIGFDETRETLATSPMKGHYHRAKIAPHRLLREVRVDDASEFETGKNIDVTIFEGVDKVHVTGRSKGRGFAGTIKRHNFTSGPKAHGSKNIREPGSVGMCATPSRIFKGKRLPGRMGGDRTTTRNLKVVQVDAENNLLFVKGSVPGANNGFVLIRKG
jgi:large subunit ribosomal protein L3